MPDTYEWNFPEGSSLQTSRREGAHCGCSLQKSGGGSCVTGTGNVYPPFHKSRDRLGEKRSTLLMINWLKFDHQYIIFHVKRIGIQSVVILLYIVLNSVEL